jgi:hypothetical protein
LNAFFLDILRGEKIRLAQFKVQDLASLAFQFQRAAEDGIGTFGLKMGDAVSEHIILDKT